MSYFQLQDFRLGMDRRRVSRFMGEAGSAWLIKNAHLSRGGDIVRRKKFVPAYTLPSGTKGLFAVNNSLFVFGEAADPGVPSGVNYQRCEHVSSGSAALSEMLAASGFDGKPYVVNRYADGSIFHYFNGERVTDWDLLAEDIGDNDAVAAALASRLSESPAVNAVSTGSVVTVTAANAGTAFTISASTTDNGANPDQDLTVAEVTPNAVAVAEVVATAEVTITGGTSNPGTNKITSITVDGVEILSTAVDWTTSHSNTAALIAAQIDSFNSTPEYTADSDGATVTISAAAGTGTGPNGFAVVVTTAGDVTDSSDSAMSGGVAAVSATAQVNTVTVSGTFETADVFSVRVNGTDYTVTGAASGTGVTAQTFRKKIYSVAGANLYFSDLESPTQWVEDETALDPGFVNMALENGGQEPLTGTAEYQGLLAIFSQNAVRVWSIVESSASNAFVQTLTETGTRAHRSIRTFGSEDVFYLAESGIRSLRARDSSNSAFVNDVGTSIDPFLLEYAATLTSDQIAAAASVVDPVDGRYWLALGEYVFVFSYFPSAKISAWSIYDVGMQITDFAKIGTQIYARAGDTIYLYGGSAGTTYPSDDEAPVTVSLPYINAKTPATQKSVIGFDVVCTNDWEVRLLTNPNDESAYVTAGTASKITFGGPAFPAPGEGTAFAVDLICNRGGYATLSGLSLHYEQGSAD
jgi:hypothetical protein